MLSLDDVLAIPDGVDEERLRSMGLLPLDNKVECRENGGKR